jgi:hypothetical protein
MLVHRTEDEKVGLIEARKWTKKAKNAAEIYKWRVENSRMLDSKLRLEFAEILQELNLHGNIFIDQDKGRPAEAIDLVFVIINVVRTPDEERQITRLIKEKILRPLNKKLRANPGLRTKGLQLTSRVVFVPPRTLVDEKVGKGRAKIFKEEKQVLTVLKNGINAEIKARQMRFCALVIKNLNLKAGPATDRIAGILVRLVELHYSGIQTEQAFSEAIDELNVKVNGRLREILSSLSLTEQEVSQLLLFQRALAGLNSSSLQTTSQVRDQFLLIRLMREINFVSSETQIIKLLKESKSGISLNDLLTEFALSLDRFNFLMGFHPELEVSGNIVRIKTIPETKEEKGSGFEANIMDGERLR